MEGYFPFTSPSWELEVYWQVNWLELLGSGVVQQSPPKSASLSTIPNPLPTPPNRSSSFQASPNFGSHIITLQIGVSPPCRVRDTVTSKRSLGSWNVPRFTPD